MKDIHLHLGIIYDLKLIIKNPFFFIMKKQTKITQFFPKRKIEFKKRKNYTKMLKLFKNLNVNITV